MLLKGKSLVFSTRRTAFDVHVSAALPLRVKERGHPGTRRPARGNYRRVTPSARARSCGNLSPVKVGAKMTDRPRLLTGLLARRKELLEELYK